MGIIELAQIQLLEGTTITTPLLRDNLQQVKKVIEDFNGLPTNFFVDQDDNSKLYVIGGWETVEQHSKGFSGSEQQKSILSLIQDQMTITWQLYVDIDCQEVQFALSDWVTIVRYDIAQGANLGRAEEKVLRRSFERLATRPVDGAVHDAGGWAQPGSMTAVKDLRVQISAFSDKKGVESYFERCEGLCTTFKDDYDGTVRFEKQVVKFFRL